MEIRKEVGMRKMENGNNQESKIKSIVDWLNSDVEIFNNIGNENNKVEDEKRIGKGLINKNKESTEYTEYILGKKSGNKKVENVKSDKESIENAGGVEIKPLLVYEKKCGETINLIDKVESGNKVYRLIPDRMLENGKHIEEFLKTISALEKSYIGIEDKRILIDETMPLHYEILIEKGEIKFFYVIPEKYDAIATSKLKRTYSTATIMGQEDYISKFEGKSYCSFNNSKHFLYSLNTDYRENGFIEGILSLVQNVEDTILIQISFLPLNDSWKDKWNNVYERARDGKAPDMSPNAVLYVLDGVSKVIDSSFDLVDNILGVETEVGKKVPTRRGNNDRVERVKDRGRVVGKDDSNSRRPSEVGVRGGVRGDFSPSRNTSQKILYDGFNTQIKMYCDNPDKTYYYGKMLGGVFNILDDDQKIDMGKVVKNVTTDRKIDRKLNKMILNSKEISVLLQQPNRRLQREFADILKSIDNVESNIPEILKFKGIKIGKAKYKGKEFDVHWPVDKHMAPMHKVITGLQRTGKTSYLANFVVDAIMKGDSAIVLDTIKECDLANEIRDHLPQRYADKLVIIDFSNIDYLIPLAWNEITQDVAGSDRRERLKKSSLVAGNFEYFLETVGEMKSEQTKLSPRMKKYLSAACRVVFSIDGTNIKDVLDCLMYHADRESLIARSGLKNTDSAIIELRRLDEEDKHGNIETKYSEISGIIDRASLLFNDYILELMLSTPNNNKIDFKYWADNGYCVLLKMSELDFSRSALKTLVTLLYSKIWLAMFARGKGDNHRLTHVVLDEVHNFPQVTDMLKLNCREAAKYGLSYVFTSHLLKDLKGLLPYIKGSGGNFMLFKTTRENYRLLEDELLQGGFAIEDCMQIKDFSTVNIVNYDRDYTVFSSRVEDQLHKRMKFYDRSDMDNKHSIKYGVEYVE